MSLIFGPEMPMRTKPPPPYDEPYMTEGRDVEAFGPNVWIVDAMYRRFLDDPASLSPAWREFFEDYRPHSSSVTKPPTGPVEPLAGPVPTQPPTPAPPPPSPGGWVSR